MSLWSDDRAAAIQVGAIVLFAFVIIAITSYQATVVPGQNEEIEFNHNQRVQGQLQELEGAVGSMPATQDRRTVTVDLSTSYPARTIFINPPTPTGRLQTVGTENETVAFTVQNATATNDDVDDFWNGTPKTYSTGAITYQPNYNVYNEAPTTVVESSLVYNVFADRTALSVNSQSLFDGDSISLIALRGSFRENGGTASVNVRPVSASTTTVPVEATGSKNVTISIVTRLSPNDWNETIADSGEFANQSGYVANVTGTKIGSQNGQSLYRVNFTMVRNQTYDLQLARVGVGELSTGEGTTNASYTVAVTDTVTTEENTNATVTVEVRDQYDNPKSGVTVNATAVGGAGGSIADSPKQTNEDGRVTFTYNTTDDVSGASSRSDTIRVSYNVTPSSNPSDSFNENDSANVTTEVTVKNTNGNGLGGGGGGEGAYNVTWQNPDSDSAVTCSEAPPRGECTIDVGGNAYAMVTLTMETHPIVDGAGVSYAVSDQTVGTLNPTSGTVTSGTDSTTLNVTSNGTVYTYVSSGDDGDRINFTVTDVGGGGGGGNSPPSARAGGPYTVNEGENIQLDGTGSSDSDGNITSYSWTITSGSGTLSNADTATPTYSAPTNVASDTNMRVELTVTDNEGATSVDSAVITVKDTGAADSNAPTIKEFSGLVADSQANPDYVEVGTLDIWDNGTGVESVEIQIKDQNGNQVGSKSFTGLGGQTNFTKNSIRVNATSDLSNNKPYTVTVITTDQAGNTQTQTKTVSAKNNPKIQFEPGVKFVSPINHVPPVLRLVIDERTQTQNQIVGQIDTVSRHSRNQ